MNKLILLILYKMTTFTIKNSSTLYKITLADAKTVKIIEIKDNHKTSDG